MSTFAGLSEALFAEIRFLALLNALSDRVDVAGVQKICFATLPISGNFTQLILHQSSTFVLDITGSRDRYIFNSS